MINATRKWIFLKVSSLLMVPFMIWFLIKFLPIYDGNYQIIVEFFSSKSSTILFSMFIIITFFNSALNISEIFEDYINNKKTIIGIILIVCGGIYIFIREKVQDQPIVTEKPLR